LLPTHRQTVLKTMLSLLSVSSDWSSDLTARSAARLTKSNI